MSPIMELLVMMLTLSSVVSQHMDWGDNPDLVEESDPIQGREHIMRLVALVGDSIDLECQVLSASKPVGKILLKKDGKIISQTEDPIVETNQDGVFIEAHLKIDIITEEMGASTVSCEYSMIADSIEAEFHVHTLQIDASKEVCETCDGDIELIFKETNGSSSTTRSANVYRRIQSKIAEMTNVQSGAISVNKSKSEYFLSRPIATIRDNNAILAMKPKYIIGGTVMDSLDHCKCGPSRARTNSGMSVDISMVIAALSAIVAICF
eukprot:GFUD01126964.1.p1 GENE.GFUD01126964.1~~GFUD01126964.1.p1  ORF type:complete len:265 (+),score=61.44 GFUD01126964.1:154-948(+)